MRRIRDLLILVLCILLALAPVVSANSLPSYWEGTDASGLFVTGEQCPIEVVEEMLTFDIPQLSVSDADQQSGSDSSGEGTASVTAEYVLHNPTDADVTATLLFPLGDRPLYGSGSSIDLTRFGVRVDGEAVELALRHSFRDGIPFSAERDTAFLREEAAEHEFYSPGLRVTKYTYRLTGAEPLAGNFDTAKLLIDSDPALTKTMVEPARSHAARSNGALVGTALAEDGTVTVFEIGQPSETPHQWTLGTEGQMELVATEEMTFRELALSRRPADSQISELDWYNIMVDSMAVSEFEGGFFFGSTLGIEYDSVMPWYCYELTIPAGGTVFNTVTAPLYPAINEAWSPPVYTYRYLLSPAKGWADFGTLDIQINTPYYMTQCVLEGFERTEKGYALRLEGLPDKELEFVLSEDDDPRLPGSGPGAVIRIAALPVLLGLWLWRRKGRGGEANG